MTRSIKFPTAEGVKRIIEEKDAKTADTVLDALYTKILMFEEDMTPIEFDRYAKRFNALLSKFAKAGLVKDNNI